MVDEGDTFIHHFVIKHSLTFIRSSFTVFFVPSRHETYVTYILGVAFGSVRTSPITRAMGR